MQQELLAVRHRAAVGAKKVFIALSEHVSDNFSEAHFFRVKVEKAMHRWHFQQWKDAISVLREERRLSEIREQGFVDKYRAIRYGKLFFEALA